MRWSTSARRFVAGETLHEAIAAAGYRVRIYTPYGQAWYPYLVRRLAERPANLLFLVRSLFAR